MAAALTFFILFSIQLSIYGYAQQQEKCPKTPPLAVEKGGYLVNPNLDLGLRGWKPFGEAKIQLRRSGVNNYIVATNRTSSTDSATQTFSNLKNDQLYQLSAWIRVSQGSARVTPVFRTVSGSSYFLGEIGTVKSGCWTELRSDFSFDVSEQLQLYFESQTVEVEIWADSLSLIAANGPGQR